MTNTKGNKTMTATTTRPKAPVITKVELQLSASKWSSALTRRVMENGGHYSHCRGDRSTRFVTINVGFDEGWELFDALIAAQHPYKGESWQRVTVVVRGHVECGAYRKVARYAWVTVHEVRNDGTPASGQLVAQFENAWQSAISRGHTDPEWFRDDAEEVERRRRDRMAARAPEMLELIEAHLRGVDVSRAMRAVAEFIGHEGE